MRFFFYLPCLKGWEEQHCVAFLFWNMDDEKWRVGGVWDGGWVLSHDNTGLCIIP
jgi:hypothetical protein